ADAARRGVHQQALAALQVREILQRVPSGQEYDGDARGLLERDPLRDAAGVARVDSDEATEGAGRERHHALAEREAGDAFAQACDAPGALAAERTRFARVHPERVEHVAEVETRREHLDL